MIIFGQKGLYIELVPWVAASLKKDGLTPPYSW
jgi:hypothetical protein